MLQFNLINQDSRGIKIDFIYQPSVRGDINNMILFSKQAYNAIEEKLNNCSIKLKALNSSSAVFEITVYYNEKEETSFCDYNLGFLNKSEEIVNLIQATIKAGEEKWINSTN